MPPCHLIHWPLTRLAAVLEQMLKYNEIQRGILVPRYREMCNLFGEQSLYNSIKSCHLWHVAISLVVESPRNMFLDHIPRRLLLTSAPATVQSMVWVLRDFAFFPCFPPHWGRTVGSRFMIAHQAFPSVSRWAATHIRKVF